MRKKAGSKNLHRLVSKWREACFLAENIKKSVIKYISIFKRVRFFFKSSLKRNQIFVRHGISTSLFKIFSKNKQAMLSKNVLNENKKRNGIYKNYNKKQQKFLNHDTSGFVAILICLLVPIILFSVKFSLDYATEKRFALHKKATSANTVFKNCAEDAALAVAKNYNPGIELIYQYEGLLKVADAVYNNYPTHYNSSVGEAIPGLNRVDVYSVEKKGTFNPIRILNRTISAMNRKATEIVYSTNDRYSSIQTRLGPSKLSPATSLWTHVDIFSSKELRSSILDEVDEYQLAYNNYILNQHEMFINPCFTNAATGMSFQFKAFHCTQANPASNHNKSYTYPYGGNFLRDYRAFSTESGSSINGTAADGKYTYRYPDNQSKVQIAIDKTKDANGCIKVTTDNDVGYAIPAECNVDIILAVPTNAAACNPDNLDTTSYPTAGQPWTGTATPNSIPTNAKNTPIYQIGQACKEFVKEFYHTRGTYMALIPYSGKVSLKGAGKWESYSSSLSREDWTAQIFAFNNNYFSHSTSHTKFYSVICGAALYSTCGQKDANLYQSSYDPYNGDKNKAVLPIMSRLGRPANRFERYGLNDVFTGDLLSTEDPRSTFTKFRQMPPNPCYMGYANMLSGKCERTCYTYLPNPYYIVELTADLPRIYEFCNALYPHNDPHNVSNFIFIPVTWAANLLQPWSFDPGISASPHTLSRPNKTTSGRKKVLILIINKPDYFEQREMTYLGFNNDLSEIPISDSDCIRFDLNHSDSGVKDAYGNSFNGTIAGPKRILQFSGNGVSRNASSGYYECESGSGTLSFPQKGLIKVVVEPSIVWKRHNISGEAVDYGNGSYYVIKDTSAYHSTSGSSWTRYSVGKNTHRGIAYGKNIVVTSDYNGRVYYYNGSYYDQCMPRLLYIISGKSEWMHMFFDSTILQFIIINSYGDIMTSTNGVYWQMYPTNLGSIISSGWNDICKHSDGYYYAIAKNGYIARSSNLFNWIRTDDNSLVNNYGKNISWISITSGGDGNLYVCANYDYGYVAFSPNGFHWRTHEQYSGKIIFPCCIRYVPETDQYLMITAGVGLQYRMMVSEPAWVEKAYHGSGFGFCYGEGRYYIFGNDDRGLIFYSDNLGPDYRYWQNYNTNLPGLWRGMCYFDKKVVASRRDGYVCISENKGVSYQNKGYLLSDGEENIVYNPYDHDIVDVNTSGETAKSKSGTSWSKYPNSTLRSIDSWWMDMCYLNNEVYAISRYGKIAKTQGFTSNWGYLASLSNFSSAIWESICIGHNNCLYALNDSGIVAYSSDGTTWNKQNKMSNYLTGLTTSAWRTIRYYPETNKYVIGNHRRGDGVVTITTRSENCHSFDGGLSICYCNGRYHASFLYEASYSNSPALVSSWKSVSLPRPSENYGLASGNGIILLTGIDGHVSISNDNGDNYQLSDDRILYLVSQNSVDFRHICYDPINDIFITLTANGNILTSSDGKEDWRRALKINDFDWSDVCCLDNCYYCLGRNGHICVIFGPQFNSYSLRSSPGSYGAWYSICAGHDSKLYAISDYGYVFTSSDTGSSWTQHTEFTNYLRSIRTDGWRCIRYITDKNEYLFLNENSSTSAPGFVTAEVNSTIRFSNIKITSNSTNSSTYKINGRETFYIDPDQISEEKTVTFSMQNVRLISAEITNRPYDSAHNFTKIPLPEMTRAVDFSVNGPNYIPSASYIQIDKNFHNHWIYGVNRYYNNKNNNGWFLHLYFLNLPGDLWYLMEDHESVPRMLLYSIEGPNVDNINRRYFEYRFSGLHNIFKSFEHIVPEEKNGYTYVDILNGLYPLNMHLIHGGITFPINSVLYYGYGDGKNFSYQMHCNTNGSIITYDSNDAVKNATLRACEKFKSIFGANNTKIYVIKYRGQSLKKSPISGEPVSENYEYLKSCAEPAGEFYEISSESDLKSRLRLISEDIKRFSAYKEAKIIK